MLASMPLTVNQTVCLVENIGKIPSNIQISTDFAKYEISFIFCIVSAEEFCVPHRLFPTAACACKKNQNIY